jgi:hypothetical protein
MYKVINHNIKEEHYDRPATLPRDMFPDLLQPLSDGELPKYVMTETTMLFRMDARTAWMKWVFSLMNYAVSLNGNLPGTEQVKGRMHKNAVALGEFITPYYGVTAANLLSTALISIGDVGMHYVEAMKAKKSPEELAEIAKTWDPYVESLAKLLNELNPGNWPKTLLSDIMSNIVLTWQEQLAARANGDIVKDEIAIDKLTKLTVTGLPNHVRKGFSSLADIFSRGIIAQFPGTFIS